MQVDADLVLQELRLYSGLYKEMFEKFQEVTALYAPGSAGDGPHVPGPNLKGTKRSSVSQRGINATSAPGTADHIGPRRTASRGGLRLHVDADQHGFDDEHHMIPSRPHSSKPSSAGGTSPRAGHMDHQPHQLQLQPEMHDAFLQLQSQLDQSQPIKELQSDLQDTTVNRDTFTGKTSEDYDRQLVNDFDYVGPSNERPISRNELFQMVQSMDLSEQKDIMQLRMDLDRLRKIVVQRVEQDARSQAVAAAVQKST